MGTEMTSPLHRTGASGKEGSVLKLRKGYGSTKGKASAGFDEKAAAKGDSDRMAAAASCADSVTDKSHCQLSSHLT